MISNSNASGLLEPNAAGTDEDEQVRPDRRAALEKLAKLAAYTPPVMLTLMLSQRASAASCGVDPFPPCDPL